MNLIGLIKILNIWNLLNKILNLWDTLLCKRSHGHDGISSEILKLGAVVLVVPLTFIINFSISTGKFPTQWKVVKIFSLHKKGDKKFMKNYWPVALLSVDGMIHERVIVKYE